MKFRIETVYDNKKSVAAQKKTKQTSKEVTTAVKKDVKERTNTFRAYERNRKKWAADKARADEKERMQQIISGQSLKAYIKLKYAEARARGTNTTAMNAETAQMSANAAFLSSVGYKSAGVTSGVSPKTGKRGGVHGVEMTQAEKEASDRLYEERMRRFRENQVIPGENREWDPVKGDKRGYGRSVSKSIRDTGKAAGETSERVSFMNSRFARFSIIMSGIAASLFVFQNIVRAIKAMITVIVQMESAAEKANATLGLTNIEMNNMTEYARSIGQSGFMGADEVFNRLTELEMKGYSAAEAMKMLQEELAWKESTMGEMETSLASLGGSLKELLIVLGEANKKRMVGFFDEMASAIDRVIEMRKMSLWERFIAHLENVGTLMEKYHKYFSVTGWFGINPSDLIDKINIGPQKAPMKQDTRGLEDFYGDYKPKFDPVKQRAVQKKLYDELKSKAAGYYNFKIAEIQRTAKAERNAGADAVLVAIATTERMKQLNLEAHEAKMKKHEAEKIFYDELQWKAEGYYEWKLQQIDLEFEKLKIMYGESMALTAAMEARKKQLGKEQLENSRNWLDGMKAGWNTWMETGLNAGQIVQNSTTGMLNTLGNAITDFASGAKKDWKSMAQSIINEISKIIIKMLIMLAIQKAIDMWGGSKGGTFSGGFDATSGSSAYPTDQTVSHARGGIVNSKKYFRFAGGIGMMGEAGAEAIMPLKRDSQGRLGVTAEGTAAQTIVPPVTVNIYNNTDKDTEATTESEFNGKEYIVTIWLDAYARNEGGLRDILGTK